MEIQRTQCCGIKELTGFTHEVYDTPEQRFKHYYEHNRKKTAFIFFSDIGDAKQGKAFAKYIKDNNLGEIVHSVKTNPNSKNKLNVWLWTIKPSVITKHYKKITT